MFFGRAVNSLPQFFAVDFIVHKFKDFFVADADLFLQHIHARILSKIHVRNERACQSNEHIAIFFIFEFHFRLGSQLQSFFCHGFLNELHRFELQRGFTDLGFIRIRLTFSRILHDFFDFIFRGNSFNDHCIFIFSFKFFIHDDPLLSTVIL